MAVCIAVIAKEVGLGVRAAALGLGLWGLSGAVGPGGAVGPEWGSWARWGLSRSEGRVGLRLWGLSRSDGGEQDWGWVRLAG